MTFRCLLCAQAPLKLSAALQAGPSLLGSEAESIELVFTEASLPDSPEACKEVTQLRHTEGSCYHFSEDSFMAQPSSGLPCTPPWEKVWGEVCTS